MENKKVGIVAACVLALIVAAGVIYWTYKSQQVEIVRTIDGGINPKLQAAEDKKAGKDEKDPNALGDK